MSEIAKETEKPFDESSSSVSSKWAVDDSAICDSFSNYGEHAVIQMNDYLEAQEQARRNNHPPKLYIPFDRNRTTDKK
jgi:hypothetical protein